MIRFLFRFTGLWLLAGAFVGLVIDGTRAIASSRFIFTPLRETWSGLHPASLESLQKAAPPWLQDPVLTGLLAAPFWVHLGVLGLLFLAIGRRRRGAAIGYSSRD